MPRSLLPLIFFFASRSSQIRSSVTQFEFKPYLIPSAVLYTTFSTRGSFQFTIGASYLNGSFPCCPKPLFQSEAKCKAIDIKCICYFHANETHFLKKGFAVGLVSKVSLSNSEMAYSLDISLKPKIGNAIYSIRIHVVIYDDAKF